ncbi:hypothetical protein GCM10010985_01310 [Caballeronia grimmiae]|uniref:Uncharacterized protein n=1 Tax=Caballeronia grimmiae TaxID=1071679 RepID=A0ABQ1QZR2_9BURK|nr:hypothetical protein GCM10010985_01310 [Caballeronia grimmiae]
MLHVVRELGVQEGGGVFAFDIDHAELRERNKHAGSPDGFEIGSGEGRSLEIHVSGRVDASGAAGSP